MLTKQWKIWYSILILWHKTPQNAPLPPRFSVDVYLLMQMRGSNILWPDEQKFVEAKPITLWHRSNTNLGKGIHHYTHNVHEFSNSLNAIIRCMVTFTKNLTAENACTYFCVKFNGDIRRFAWRRFKKKKTLRRQSSKVRLIHNFIVL